MAHNLATTNGRTAMAYFGEQPWHGLGTELAEPATAAEAMVAAGLEYGVTLRELRTADGTPVPQRKAVVRADTSDVLGVVGNSYVPVQNRECFGFLDAVVAEGNLRYHTAGALGKGERIWLLAKLPDHIQVKGSDDIAEKFLLLSNTHDGSTALRVHYTVVRVVCQNTLNLAERQGTGQGIAILHRGDLVAKVKQAQEVLGLAVRYYDDAEAKIKLLADHYPSSAQLRSYFESLYPDPSDGKSTRAENTRQELFRLFEQGAGQDIPAVRHTTWAAFNAVTEFVDHHRPTRGRTLVQRQERRLDSSWFGSGSRLKQQAFQAAVRLASLN